MSNAYHIFKEFIAFLPDLCSEIEKRSKLSGLSVEETLLLLSVFENSDYPIFMTEESFSSLLDKQLIEKKSEKLTVTSKGSILAKSIINTIERSKS